MMAYCLLEIQSEARFLDSYLIIQFSNNEIDVSADS